MLSACNQTEDPANVLTTGNSALNNKPLQSTPLADHSTNPDSPKLFESVSAEESGLDFTNELKPENIRNYLLNGAGVCTGDYDNDGLVDIFLISQDGDNRLFRQTASWKFEDVTASAGGDNLKGADLWGTGASFADVNNDGWLDLYVCNSNGANQLFINQQDGQFTEAAETWQVDFSGPSTMASFADYDHDGDLDMYLVNNRLFSIYEENPKIKLRYINGEKTVHPDFQNDYGLLDGRLIETGHADRLYRNTGNGVFEDATEAAGIAGFDMGLSATWWDYDDDGWLDLYVANDLKTPDHLYKNNGDGTFTDVIPQAIRTTSWFSMGADVADINNDGKADLLVADMSSTTHYKQKTTMGEMGNSAWFLTIGQPRQFMRNYCYLGTGTEALMEGSNLLGVDSTDWTWSVRFADFDCDGLEDLFTTNGVGRNVNDSDTSKKHKALVDAGLEQEAEEFIATVGALKENNLLYRNVGDLKFQPAQKQWGADYFGVSNGATCTDIDRDGDPDLIVNNLNAPASLFRNTGTSGNRIIVKLVGTKSNRFGVGCEVEIVTTAGRQTKTLTLARGYMSAETPQLLFGLGDQETIEELVVRWPSGIEQRFTDLAVNQMHTVTEQPSEHTSAVPAEKATNKTWFKPLADRQGLDFMHKELAFDDFQHQPLLPNKLSQLGPGMAWADVNGDGLFDCFLCGARGQSGELYIRDPQSLTFEKSRGPWKQASAVEEVAALFFDFDSDGDQDLLVASGGNEYAPDSKNLLDALYINDGSGGFEAAAEGILPEIKAAVGSISAVDFDRDGDMDLFLGARLIPRQWPMPPASYLLRNDDGKFVDATAEVCPDLSKLGCVTSSVWSDTNGDGWLDLVVAVEWGPIRILQNQDGSRLIDQTTEAGLADEIGWWNSVVPGDIDNDGDLDYLCCNTGLNTKYHTDENHPLTLYVNDFDGNGRIDLVESEWEGDTCFPIRGKSCSTHAMPMVSEKFTTYHEFALADLNDIYGEEPLSEASKFSVSNLSSVILINDGHGRFEVRELPRMAQISPGFGAAIEDFDGDGNCDIVIAQNFFHPQPETGQMDGGLGLYLKGNGNGDFDFIGPKETGIIVPVQTMALAVTDINQDCMPDFVMATNDGPLFVFENQIQNTAKAKNICVRIKGAAGNLNGAGCRLQLSGLDGNTTSRVVELHAGSGYLSQSPGEAFFTRMQHQTEFDKLNVQLPNGETRTIELSDKQNVYVIEL